MNRTVVLYDKANGSVIAWKSFKSLYEAEEYAKNMSRINGISAEVEAKV